MSTHILPPRPMPDDPQFPTALDLVRARGWSLIERSHAVAKAGRDLVKHFTHPSWQELQLEDSKAAELVARAIADVRDNTSLDKLPVRVREGYRNAAALALRFCDEDWRKEAHSEAVLQVEIEMHEGDSPAAQNAARNVDTPEVEWILQAGVRRYLDVLQGRGVKPETYLRIKGQSELERRR